MYKWILFVILLSLTGYSDARMMGSGMMGSEAEPPPPPDHKTTPEIRKGYELVQSYCAQCHQAPNPVQHTAAEWPSVLARMQHYMQQQHRPVPNNADRKLMLDYLDQPH